MSHLVLYDGVCGLCDHFVQFLIRIDRHDRLRFAALQGPLGTAIVEKAGRSSSSLSTVIVVAGHGTHAGREVGRRGPARLPPAPPRGVYRAVSAFRIVPRFLRDRVYDRVARWRYRIFGRFDACPIPRPETSAKFLDFKTKTDAR